MCKTETEQCAPASSRILLRHHGIRQLLRAAHPPSKGLTRSTPSALPPDSRLPELPVNGAYVDRREYRHGLLLLSRLQASVVCPAAAPTRRRREQLKTITAASSCRRSGAIGGTT